MAMNKTPREGCAGKEGTVYRIFTFKMFRRVDEERDCQHHSARNGKRRADVFLAGAYGVIVVWGKR